MSAWVSVGRSSPLGCALVHRIRVTDGCGLGAVDASLVFGLVRGAGAFAAVLPLPSFVLVSRMPFAQRYRGNATSFSGATSSRLEAMVGGALGRASSFRVGLVVSGATIGLDRALAHHTCGFLACRPPLCR